MALFKCIPLDVNDKPLERVTGELLDFSFEQVVICIEASSLDEARNVFLAHLDNFPSYRQQVHDVTLVQVTVTP